MLDGQKLYTFSGIALDVLICLLYIWAAYLVHRQLRSPISIKHMTRLQYLRLKNWLHQPELELKLARTGYPFKLNAWQLQTIRYGVAVLWLMSSLYNLLFYWELLELPTILMQVWGPIVFLLLTNTRASLLTYFLKKYKEIDDGEKNRELFMIYSMIVDELRGVGRRRLNLHTLLTKLRDYTSRIKPSLNRGLRLFDEGAPAALQVIAEDIGTREARELCKLLADLEMTPPEQISALVDAREESYTQMLRENRRRRRKFFGNLAYAVAFSPLLIYLWNALNIAQQYVTDLARNTNQLG
ncbi:hypothetical protein [Paenibacillus xerothermodurans]|uniref:Type II secretion system protein GspF domain-containing protein n=1 Tax=Paenibacillus xerothermodurans TaxID=1977292 RepID=A0A2W1N7S9_PAEXE|nr:hypothetical protein [Paenibacillus xerothermodurans]PZE20689.1 hypothetical protein CBW46_010955 [Paenibacillus xerothermodurans]